ncbi:hypothetical protein A1F97_11403, partial [Pyrenophora tritici-repentis]
SKLRQNNSPTFAMTPPSKPSPLSATLPPPNAMNSSRRLRTYPAEPMNRRAVLTTQSWHRSSRRSLTAPTGGQTKLRPTLSSATSSKDKLIAILSSLTSMMSSTLTWRRTRTKLSPLRIRLTMSSTSSSPRLDVRQKRSPTDCCNMNPTIS